MITFDYSHEVVRWVAPRLDDAFFGEAVGIGIKVDGIPAAGCVFSEYRAVNGNPVDVRASIVVVNKRWASRRSLNVLFAYPFNHLKVPRVTTIIAKSNRPSRVLVEKLGFVLEGTHPFGFDGKETALTYGCYRQAAERWLKEPMQPDRAVA